MSDIDYTELSELAYGQAYSSDVARRMFYGSKRTLELMDSNTETKLTTISSDDIDTKIIELKKERRKFFDERNALNKLINHRARQEELNEILVRTLEKATPPLNYEQREIKVSDNDILVSLNDIHYGACYSNYWGSYNPDIFREMLKGYLDKIIHIGKFHNSQNCIVWENGDAISGRIHLDLQVSNTECSVEQTKHVAEIISQFLIELSKHFNTVKFVDVSGNHSRLEPDKNKALVPDRLDDMIGWYLQARLSNIPNIEVGACEKIHDTMYILNIRGKNYVGVHGDFDSGKTAIQDLNTLCERPIYAVLLGHLHHNKTDKIQGIKTIMAGSFLGMDEHCIKNRIYGNPEQQICICDNSGVRCIYDIQLKEETS